MPSPGFVFLNIFRLFSPFSLFPIKYASLLGSFISIVLWRVCFILFGIFQSPFPNFLRISAKTIDFRHSYLKISFLQQNFTDNYQAYLKFMLFLIFPNFLNSTPFFYFSAQDSLLLKQ